MPLKIRPNAIEQEDGSFIFPGVQVLAPDDYPVIVADPTLGWVGIGIETPTQNLTVLGRLGEGFTQRNTRVTSTDAAAGAAFDLVLRTTGSSLFQGHGPGMLFSIESSTVGPNYIAGVYGTRTDGDTSGRLAVFSRNPAASPAWGTRLFVDHEGILFLNDAALTTTGSSISLVSPGGIGINTLTPARPLDIESSPDLFVRLGTTGTNTAAQIEYYRGGVGTYMGPTSGNEFHLYSFENIPFMIGLNNAEEFRITQGLGPILPDNRYLQFGQFITGSAAWPSEPSAGDWIVFGQDLPVGLGLTPYVRHDGAGPWGYPQPIISRDLGDYRVTTSFHLFGPSYYIAGMRNSLATTTGAPAINTYWSIPFTVNQRFVVTGIGFYVTGVGGAGSVARVGIYDSEAQSDARPRRLILDGGEKGTNGTGTKVTTGLSVELIPGTLYFATYHCGVGAPTIKTLDPGSVFPMYGFSSIATADVALGLANTQSYGALLASHPTAGSTMDSADPIPAIFMTFN